MVECGGLENRLARNPGHGGSNPPSSARLHAAGTGNRACFVFSPPVKRCEHLRRGCGRIVGPFGPVRSPYVQPRLKGQSPRHAEAHRRRREDRQDVGRARQNPAPLGGGRGQAAAEVPRGQVRALRRRGPGQGDGDGSGRRVLQGNRGGARHREPRCCTLLAERRRNEGGADGRSGKDT